MAARKPGPGENAGNYLSRNLKPPAVPDITQTTKAVMCANHLGLPIAGELLTIYTVSGNPNLVRRRLRDLLTRVCGVSKDRVTAYLRQIKLAEIQEDDEE